MKATNIYQTLKAQGPKAKSTKPQLPGVASPLKKSPYKFNAGLKEAAAKGKLDSNPKFKAAVESSPAKKYRSDAQRKAVHASKAEKNSPAKKKVDGKPKKEVKAQSITYDPASGTTTRTFSDADVKKYNVKKQIVTKAKPKSPAKKKSCGSPVKMDVTGRKPNPRKNKARKGVTKKLMGLRNANRGCKPARRAYGG